MVWLVVSACLTDFLTSYNRSFIYLRYYMYINVTYIRYNTNFIYLIEDGAKYSCQTQRNMTRGHISGVQWVMLLWPLGVYMAICNVVDMKGVMETGCCDGCVMC